LGFLWKKEVDVEGGKGGGGGKKVK
jgi:hypothetical protein